jgi:predicted aspartyl protease
MTVIHSHDYDSSYHPAMPIIEIQVARRVNEASVTLNAIVDSGADATQIPISVLNRLQARKAGSGWLTVSSGARYRVNLYKIVIEIGSYRPIYVDIVGSDQDEIIVGRDVLNQFLVTLDAPGFIVQIAE